jgi:hypothetical protein
MSCSMRANLEPCSGVAEEVRRIPVDAELISPHPPWSRPAEEHTGGTFSRHVGAGGLPDRLPLGRLGGVT